MFQLEHSALCSGWNIQRYILSRNLRTYAQLLPHRKVEVKQLGAFGVVDAAYVEVRACEGRGDVFHVEEEDSGIGSGGPVLARGLVRRR
jgi:hypothetical protein